VNRARPSTSLMIVSKANVHSFGVALRLEEGDGDDEPSLVASLPQPGRLEILGEFLFLWCLRYFGRDNAKAGYEKEQS